MGIKDGGGVNSCGEKIRMCWWSWGTDCVVDCGPKGDSGDWQGMVSYGGGRN